MRKTLFFLTLMVVVGLALVVASANGPPKEGAAETTGSQVGDAALGPWSEAPLFTPVKKGGGPPPSDECCDPALEPGVGGNPLCFEGHMCCPGGWQCNNPDGTPACPKPGEVCPTGCAGVGEACNVNADCCFNRCKGGRCR